MLLPLPLPTSHPSVSTKNAHALWQGTRPRACGVKPCKDFEFAQILRLAVDSTSLAVRWLWVDGGFGVKGSTGCSALASRCWPGSSACSTSSPGFYGVLLEQSAFAHWRCQRWRRIFQRASRRECRSVAGPSSDTSLGDSSYEPHLQQYQQNIRSRDARQNDESACLAASITRGRSIDCDWLHPRIRSLPPFHSARVHALPRASLVQSKPSTCVLTG